MRTQGVEWVASSWLCVALACGSPGDAETTGPSTGPGATVTGTLTTSGPDGTTGSSTTGSSTTGSDTTGSDTTGPGTSSTTGDTPTSSSDTGGAETTGEDGPGVRPPEPGPMTAPVGDGVAFAVSRFFLGDTDRDGTPNKPDGWRQYGYDLDGKISDAVAAGLCTPREGADPGNVHPDGDDGIDNGFGKHILPILSGFSADISMQQDARVQSGEYTLIFDLLPLGPGAESNPVHASHYVGADLGAPPKLDGTDMWPIDGSSLVVPGDILTPKLEMIDSYVVGNTWVGYAPPDAILKLRVAGLDLLIRQAVITMDLDASHESVPRGTLAGVLSVLDLREELTEWAGSFDPNLCSGATLESILVQVEQAADILLGGPQDPTKECDAVSIGIGFEAIRVQLGPVVAAVPEQDFCP